MPLPEHVRRSCDRALRVFHDRRVPAKVRDQVHLEWTFRGNAVNLFERRRPWRGKEGEEWTRSKVARFELDLASRTWRLSWADRNQRWRPIQDLEAIPSFADALREVEADPHGAFWG